MKFHKFGCTDQLAELEPHIYGVYWTERAETMREPVELQLSLATSGDVAAFTLGKHLIPVVSNDKLADDEFALLWEEWKPREY